MQTQNKQTKTANMQANKNPTLSSVFSILMSLNMTTKTTKSLQVKLAFLTFIPLHISVIIQNPMLNHTELWL